MLRLCDSCKKPVPVGTFCTCPFGVQRQHDFDVRIRRDFNKDPNPCAEFLPPVDESKACKLGEIQINFEKIPENALKPNPKASFGAAKPGVGNVSQLVMLEVAVGMLEGAMKYGRHNYRDNEGIEAQTYYEATRRHLDYWWEGEDIDPDSELSHITKAIASLTVLRDAMLTGHFVDNRPPAMPEMVEWRRALEKIIDKLHKKYPFPKMPIVGKK